MTSETMVYRKGHGVVTKSRAAEIDKANAPSNAKADFLPDSPERGSWVFRNGKLVPKHEARATDVRRAGRKRSKHPSPRVMSDIEEHTNMVTGEVVSSRSRHREILREHNLVEYGNDVVEKPSLDRFTNDIGQDIKDTIEQLEAGYIEPYDDKSTAIHDDGVSVDVPTDVEDGDYIRG